MIRTQILLTPSLKNDINHLALATRQSFSGATRYVLQIGLEYAQQKQKIDPLGGLLDEIKYAGKGPKDLSTNDKYLYGA